MPFRRGSRVWLTLFKKGLIDDCGKKPSPCIFGTAGAADTGSLRSERYAVDEQCSVRRGERRAGVRCTFGGSCASQAAAPSELGCCVPEASTASAAAASGAASTDAAAARTIEHKYGSTTVEGIPERVISVGYNDQDAILALGVIPVGIRDWYGDQPYAVWPWAQDELGDATPEVLSGSGINFEQVASLQPDLIVGISSGMTEEEYNTLSEIAPTIPQSGEFVDYGVPWQEQQRVIGQALGREAEAEQLVADVEARFAAARAENPQWEGAGGVVARRF